MPQNGIIIQWGWPEMEELLQCPICLEPPTGIVEQCQHGHHICSKCKPKVDNCPLCKCRYEGTRNFVVEELIRHLDIIKNTMQLNSIAEESHKRKNKTKLCAMATPFIPKPNKRHRTLPTPKCTKGEYPCRVEKCTVKLPVSRLLNHVRTFHPSVLTEGEVNKYSKFSYTWEELYRPGKYINSISRVFFISGIGLVFITLEILRTGDVIMYLQMATKYTEAQKFLGTLEFFNESNAVAFKTRMISVREDISGMLHKKLCFTIKKFTMRSLCQNKRFSCRMEISRYAESDSAVLTIQDTGQINVIAGLRASILHEQAICIQFNEKENRESNKSKKERSNLQVEINHRENLNVNNSNSSKKKNSSKKSNRLLPQIREDAAFEPSSSNSNYNQQMHEQLFESVNLPESKKKNKKRK